MVSPFAKGDYRGWGIFISQGDQTVMLDSRILLRDFVIPTWRDEVTELRGIGSPDYSRFPGPLLEPSARFFAPFDRSE